MVTTGIITLKEYLDYTAFEGHTQVDALKEHERTRLSEELKSKVKVRMFTELTSPGKKYVIVHPDCYAWGGWDKEGADQFIVASGAVFLLNPDDAEVGDLVYTDVLTGQDADKPLPLSKKVFKFRDFIMDHIIERNYLRAWERIE